MKKQVFSFIFILFHFIGFSQSELSDFIFQKCTSEEVKHAQLGVSIFDVDEGVLLAGYNHDKSFVPASSLKLITSYIALEKLGKDYTFVTKLAYSGAIVDSVLQGNIYIIGSGDPSLGSKRFSHKLQFIELIPYLSNKIKLAGIKRIDGSIISDESIFESYPISPTWQWDDLGTYYASGAWGINLNENEYEVWYNSNKPQGEIADILKIYPTIPDLKITSEVVIDNEINDEKAYVFGGPYTYDKRIVGTIPQSRNAYKIRGSMPDPPRYLAAALQQELNKKGINSNSYFTKYYNQGSSTGLTIIDSLVSDPLHELVKMANYYSVNLYSESFLKILGYKFGNRGAGSEGIKVVENFFKESGIDHLVLNMEDGSGLSVRNRVSPYLLTRLLYNQIKKHGFDYVAEYLPKSGEVGTVRRLLKTSPAFGKVWIKSGSMNQIMSYTGIMKAKSGKWISFSIMSNGYTQKSAEMRKWIEITIEGIYLKS